MANNKQIKTRLQQLHGYEADWIKAGNNSGFVPLEGEEILYMAETEETELPEYRSELITYNRKKIGDGVTNINLLPFENETLRNDVATLISDVQALEDTAATSEQLNAAIERIITLEEKQAAELIVTEITLAADNWIEDTNLYTQTLEIPSASPTSQINLHPTPEQIIDLQNQNITLTVGNNNGVVTFYAINNKPTTDYNIIITITDALSVNITPAEEGTFLTKTEGASKEYVNSIHETTEKRLERLESKLAPEYIVEDHESAYEKTVPYYSCKYADLEWMDGYTYTDSNGVLKDAKVTEIVSERVNLWNIDWIDVGTLENTETGYITQANKYDTPIGIKPSEFLALTGLNIGDTFTVSCKVSAYNGTNNTHNNIGAISFLTKDSSIASNIQLIPGGYTGKVKTKTVTIPETFIDDNYYGLYVLGTGTETRIEYSDFIISKGDTVAPYQEYREPTIVTIPEEIQAINGYGRKGSRLSFEDKTLSITYGEYTFTGTENWYPTESAVGTTGYYRRAMTTTIPMKGGTALNGLCDRYATHKVGWAACTEESIRFGQNGGSTLYFYYLGEKTVAEIREMTKGMKICYPLADEYTTITSVDIDFDGLLPVGGTAKIRFENEDQIPVQSKIVYMLKEDAQFEETSEIIE